MIHFNRLVGLVILAGWCGPAARGANLTTTTTQAAGANWTAAIWRTNGTGTAVAPAAGNTYQCTANGTTIGNGTANTRIRNPATAGIQTFPGDALTLNTNTEIRAKQVGAILDFPGVGGNPGLILNGGMLNGGDDTTFNLTGRFQVASLSYLSHGANGGGGGISPNRAFLFSAVLSGSGDLVLMNAGTLLPQRIFNPANTFSGRWIVQCGWLLGATNNALGTNSIIVDPLYNGYLAAMPNASSPAGPAWFEVNYDLNSAGSLLLTNGGVMILHQSCYFSSVKIGAVSLSAGTHSYAELAAAYPGNFATGGSGSITVQSFGPPPPLAPAFALQPHSVLAVPGVSTQLVSSVTGTLPLHYQWKKGTNNVYVNTADTGDVSGSTNATLVFDALTAADAADYRLFVTNAYGAATSQVATVTVTTQGATNPVVLALAPAAGATVGNLTQIHVTFSTAVVGVAAENLLINGQPADSFTGAGADYYFNFSQPLPGNVQVYWDIDNAITDLAGHRFDSSSSWTYNLMDGSPPVLLATTPANGSTVGLLGQARVLFSEPVSGVEASALLINGVAATNFSGSGLGPYIFQFTPPAAGPVQFSWAVGQNIRDLSSSSNLFVAAGWSVVWDPAAAAAALTNLVINEFLAANTSPSGLLDEDGQLSDWIELNNRGNTVINLTGWALTDASDAPLMWTVPATNLAPGQFLVVFASGKDRRIPGALLHTSFGLNISGDYLGLYNPEFPPRVAQEFAPAFPEQRNAYSYGLVNGGFRYFANPTPGTANGLSDLTGVVAPVHCSVGSGFFDQPFNLVLTCATPGSFILFTTNGSLPGVAGGVTNGQVCLGPLAITRTTPLRVAAFAPNLLPSLTESRTFVFIEDVVQQPIAPAGYPTGNVWTPTPGSIQNGSRAYYQMDPTIVNDPQYSNTVRLGLTSLPTLSLILPIPDLFDPATGIYSHPQSRGAGWERGCAMELLSPDGAPGPRLDCGLQIQGGTQRDPAKNAKHSFRLNFKSEYGAGRLNAALFPDSPVDRFNTLVLDGGINYWWHYVGGSVPLDQRFRAQCVRDQFVSDLMLALGQPSFHGRFFNLYLNGLYWGIDYVHERTDEDFAASYFGGDATEYDVLRNTTVGLEIVAGDGNAWNTALSLAGADLSDNAAYTQLQQWVDIDNLIDYMIVNHWVGNDDWPQHNWYVLRRRVDGGQFKFLIWDAEHVLKDVNVDRTTINAAGSPAQIYNALRNNAEFRLRYADHLQKHFFDGGVFYTDAAHPVPDVTHPERNVPAALYLKRIREIDSAIVAESARWGGYTLTTNYTRNDHWLRELNNLLGYTNNPGNTANYFPQRSARVLDAYRALGLYPAVVAPAFSNPGGNVPLGFSLTMTNPNGAGKIYYTTNGTDPRQYGSGVVSEDAVAYPAGGSVALAGSLIVNARVLSGGVWSALKRGGFTVASPGVPIRITELMYNPVGGDAYEFLELQNIAATPVDVSGFSFQGISYVFPSGTVLAPGSVLVLANAANPAAFAARYPGVVVGGYFGGQLSNSGERIALLDANGRTVISVDYQDSAGWPTAADGGGYSLEILSPDGDPDDPANWRASLALNGSPGTFTSVPLGSGIRLNEVMADNAGAVTNGGAFPDWLELFNPGTNLVNLSNWSLSDGGNPRKFVIPSGTMIAAGGYLVVWCDMATNAPGLHSGFALGRTGESLYLYDAATNRVDAFSFGLQLPNYSLGRVGLDAGWQLNLPTPGAVNLVAPLAAGTNLYINEWLANSSAGGSDWIELFNASSNQPAALVGLTFVTSNAVFRIRSQSFLGPRQFVQLFADENPGVDHLDFKLAAAGDSIALINDAGGQLDFVAFTNQLDGVSQGRLPDGGGLIQGFPGSPSPGSSNFVVAYSGPRLNEVMARNTSATYDSQGRNADWIELFNPYATNVSLAGLGLGRDPGARPEWSFPAGSVITSNGFLVLWCDENRPASTNAESEMNTGFALSASGDQVCLFNVATQCVDQVAFGFQPANLSIGRSGGAWGLLANATPGGANAPLQPLGNPASLRVNEWMAQPTSGSDWFELFNSDNLPVALGGLYLTDDPSIAGRTNSRIAPLSFIAGHGWVKLVADGQPSRGPDHVGFSLDKDGDTLRLYASNLGLIDAVDFGLQTPGASQGRLPDGGTNIFSFPTTSTPEASNFLPLPDLQINEVLTHTDPPLEDAIELFQSGSNAVDLSGWYLSNSEIDLKKYRIPNGTTVATNGYRVFYEYQFNGTNAVPFTLNSAHGDTVYVSEADLLGNLTGRRVQVEVSPAPNGVSLGRVPTSGGFDFVPLTRRTFGVDDPATVTQFRAGTGLGNAPPRVGPVVINELMYHPVTVTTSNAVENPAEEYLELLNITSNAVPLFDPAAPSNCWKLVSGVAYTFPTGVVLPARGLLLVVSFDPSDAAARDAFRSRYGLGSEVALYGPFSGKLDNAGERVELDRPDSPQIAPHPDAGFVPYVMVDSVSYGPGPPWPAAADGAGQSLQRRFGGAYGNEPLNWVACDPTPGRVTCAVDADGDGLPDEWEYAHGLNLNSASGSDGANGDPDGDGFTNWQEYLAGTDPLDANNRLGFSLATHESGGFQFSFTAVAGHSYSILYRTNLNSGAWAKLLDIDPVAVTHLLTTNDPAGARNERFYQIATPRLP